jgi:hypothetical protein
MDFNVINFDILMNTQGTIAVLAEFAALVDDCARVDPSHPQLFYWVQI